MPSLRLAAPRQCKFLVDTSTTPVSEVNPEVMTVDGGKSDSPGEAVEPALKASKSESGQSVQASISKALDKRHLSDSEQQAMQDAQWRGLHVGTKYQSSASAVSEPLDSEVEMSWKKLVVFPSNGPYA